MSGQILSVDASLYHADDLGGETPSLSASLAHTLLTYSPAHARAQHPKLNPDFKDEYDAKFDLGTAVHAMLLEGRDIVEPIEAENWRTKDAKAARDEARANGKVPLLEGDYGDALEMVESAMLQIARFDASPGLLLDGAAEQTLVWEEQGVLCRSRLDWLRDDFRAIDDLKTTRRSANPDGFSRVLFDMGYDMKAAFYLRGVKAITGVDAVFRWIVVEPKAPYALSVLTPGPDVLALADAKVDKAIRVWRDCLERNHWQGYPQQVCTVELPPWEEPRWMEREAREEAYA